MTYSLHKEIFVEHGVAAQLADLRSTRTTARNWHALDEARRMALVDRALRPANDRIDAYPMAL